MQNARFCNVSLKNRLRAMNCGPHFASCRRETALFPSPCVYSYIVQRPLFSLSLEGGEAGDSLLAGTAKP